MVMKSLKSYLVLFSQNCIIFMYLYRYFFSVSCFSVLLDVLTLTVLSLGT